jgi:oligopeptide transport system substrate-binding protein
LIPGIAESVTKSKGFTEYTFKIRKDAKWSDGRVIYAQDFVDAWLRLLSPQSTSIYSYYLFGIVNAHEYNSKKIASADDVGIKAVDDRTLVVTLKRPTQSWETTTAFWPLFPIRKDLMEKLGTNWWRAGVLVSSGPFVFDSYETGKSLTLKRNKYYRASKSNIDQIDFTLINDNDVALQKFDEKAFPVLSGLSFRVMSKLSKRADYIPIPLMRHHIIAANAVKFPMNNQNFRLAVLSSFNAAKVLPKDATHLAILKTLIPAPLPGSEKPVHVPYNLAKAKEYLKKSGIVVGPSTKLRILTSLAEPYYSIGKSIQSQISDSLKINVELAALQSQELNTYMNLAEYNLALISWTAKVVSPQDFLLPYSGESPSSRTHYNSTFYDQWIFEGMQGATVKESAESFYRAQLLLSSEQGVVNPLFYEKSGALVRPSVKNIYFDHMGNPIFKDVQLQ